MRVMKTKKTYKLPQPNKFEKNQTAETAKTPDESPPSITFFQLFRYSTRGERCVMCLAVILASLASSGVPFAIVIYGEFSTMLIDRAVGVGTSSSTWILPIFGGGKILTNASYEENMQAIRKDSAAFGFGSLVECLLLMLLIGSAVDITNRVALKQISRIRKRFLEALLRQDMSYFDTSSGNNFASKMTEDLDKMKEGLNEKIAIIVFYMMTFVVGVIASFVYGWKLTLVVLSCCPLIILSTAMVSKLQSSLTELELKAYSGAGSVAEEVFSSIRTVFAFSGERKEQERFSKLLVPAENTGQKKGLYSGIGAGTMWLIVYCCDAIALWYGVQLVLSDRDLEVKYYTPAVLVIILFGVVLGAQNIGYAWPHMESIAMARGAARNVFDIIDRKSCIDPLVDKGEKPQSVVGDIEFENAYFCYPARPDVEVLKGLSLHIKRGQTLAFVGPSGCGKSTIMQLMQRFYDPQQGTCKLDGRDLRTLNVSWLRSQIGVVGQEPVLFATTIEDNIRYGLPGCTQADIEKAARTANCHDFIMNLPRGYKTMVGERGDQMSGGQKQRIAIARALVRDPKILLLDEATSALDPTSEKRVQDALEVASQGRTTLVVSHRLSTITNAHNIVFVKDGVVAEQGTHDELMAKGGLYYQLVRITKRNERADPSHHKCEKKSYNNGEDDMFAVDKKEEADESKDDLEETEQYMGQTNSGYEASKDEFISMKRKISRQQESMEDENFNISFMQLMRMNSPEWKFIVIGSIACLILGVVFSTWALLFGDFLGALSDQNSENVQAEANYLACMFVSIGLVTGFGSLLQTYMFTTAGVRMTSRLRKTAFKTILNQEVAYFDDVCNSVGALCARLAGDCSKVQGATGGRIGIILQGFSALGATIIFSLVLSWKLTLVSLVAVPFVCLCIYFEAKLAETSIKQEKAAIEKASQVAIEAIGNIRTVASLGQERSVICRYNVQIDLVHKACENKLRYRGFVFGLGQAAPNLAYGFSLCYGGMLVADGELPYKNIIKIAEALVFGAWMLGQSLAYSPNVSEAIMSAGRLNKLFDRVPDMQKPQSNPVNIEDKCDGDVSFDKVCFEYPARKGVPILEDFDLEIEKGTTLALVGCSGSGKSTCVQLLLRYYDPLKGAVKLKNIPTTEFKIDDLRSKMGLVCQEPVLFDCTIAENISYGDNFRDDIPMAEIIEAAKKANIHDFIASLPQGYSTRLGSKGTQLSGGQKQRIAIARAMVRNPLFLILDEATSALDMESEKVVQQALDAARSGRTCVTIAHRLTTVRDADLICVLQKGVIVERGTHEQLMSLQGLYFDLYMMQQVA